MIKFNKQRLLAADKLILEDNEFLFYLKTKTLFLMMLSKFVKIIVCFFEFSLNQDTFIYILQQVS